MIETNIVKKYRKKYKITQKNLAKKFNVKQSYISQLENYIKLPNLLLILKLATFFNLCPIRIFLNFYCYKCKFKNSCKCIHKNFNFNCSKCN